MGANKKPSGKYLKVSDGKLRLKSHKNDEEAEERTVTVDGETRTLYERVYDTVDGKIVAIYKQESDEFGTSYSVVLEDEEEDRWSVQFQEDSNYFKSFISLFPNIDLEEPIEIRPYARAIEGKNFKNVGMTIYQNDEKIANYYKDWDEVKEKSILKHGLEKFKYKDKMKKSEKKKLRIDILEFFAEKMTEAIEEVKELNSSDS